ncbi:Na(+)/H(+) antiporter subunit B [Methanoculleus sp. FWC-SCC1]|uniref:Na(+)/H(+) antiporter subunit B n=1 Tax=Methanoculleus frigidifontis TaxID=2584085 RepID=A0ABT8M864_9EURY|nr:Na(+)/H(+) antiporter subunit B [Methanoculleus sp. FWC-SCC1]MDN7024094.1 Na(+)/H(+) antiporter subunit B [Methanoculleus sp. FWC-SCC1]
MKEDVVIRTVTRMIVPFIQLFGLYVILHGASSAGGGFQGGVIFASAFILYGIAFGITEARKRIYEKITTVAASLGVYIFAGIGLLAILFGGNFLGYSALPLPLPGPEIRGLMAEFVEIGIGITVMAVMTSIFYDMASKEEVE